MKHVIYKITNKLNNKSYIGKTSQDPKIRWKQHKLGMGYGNKMPIHLALKKYGESNFLFEVIYQCFEETSLDYAEVYFINEFQTLAPYGYNVDFNVAKTKDNPYLIDKNKSLSAVQSIDSDPVKTEYNLSTRTRYPVELWKTIKTLYSSGKSPKEIVKLLEVKIASRTMIANLKALGCDTSNKTRNKIRGNLKFFISEEEKQKIANDYKLGLSVVELQKKYKRANRTVRQALVQKELYISRDKKICRTA